ncbi:hypothetical protein E2562_021236 [Oryza meyeriana var. granulata]|uniref:Uncharacterized protein n=1 Tax=Oryza meyeriana var. granulata TaxID=110450 RepID=A0A6G1DYS2_9ORYZ|nr:hypothetical protein E2562_021236 [Oryza meyeriana var. granulata]
MHLVFLPFRGSRSRRALQRQTIILDDDELLLRMEQGDGWDDQEVQDQANWRALRCCLRVSATILSMSQVALLVALRYKSQYPSVHDPYKFMALLLTCLLPMAACFYCTPEIPY